MLKFNSLGSATMLEFVLSLAQWSCPVACRLWWKVGPSTASLANQAPVYCGCPAGTHGCDLVSRVRLDQSANPVVVWLGLVSRVREIIMETWNMEKSQHSQKIDEYEMTGARKKKTDAYEPMDSQKNSRVRGDGCTKEKLMRTS